jgi:hypothetical protein
MAQSITDSLGRDKGCKTRRFSDLVERNRSMENVIVQAVVQV